MNKSDLVERLAVDAFGGNRHQAGEVLESVINTITASVARGEKVTITGFGVFEKVVRNARVARNPRTGERVRVKKTSAPKFRPGKEFKEYVSGAKKVTEAPTKKAPAKKLVAKKAPAKKSVAKKSVAKKSVAKKSVAKKAIAKGAGTKRASGPGR